MNNYTAAAQSVRCRFVSITYVGFPMPLLNLWNGAISLLWVYDLCGISHAKALFMEWCHFITI